MMKVNDTTSLDITEFHSPKELETAVHTRDRYPTSALGEAPPYTAQPLPRAVTSNTGTRSPLVNDGRSEQRQVNGQVSGSGHSEESMGFLMHIGQVFLVLLTLPFLLLYCGFRLIGEILRGIGMFFVMLGDLSYQLTYKPRIRKLIGRNV
ncbi:hypothetical protein P691DRAFT_576849 [Macrolepiota fuliginosa MF-IS2]|uniref:Uncharacterized protein n=1 Tax=Macrolepiota fuliginosa MF-IS2 TaxID=1400762 RepID=A0A9P5XFC0_9AGAR|nr:hypothetical protein P691DRAFT_576849 [Macrolepiota fuliginosa MF-IS2]